jgi:opacity protein-like surface antigen
MRPRKELPVGIVNWRSAWVAGLALAVLAGEAGDARAQTIGLGARMVSVSGPESPALDNSDSSRTRFAGGFIRLHMVASLGVEVAMDYQSTTNDAETARIRNMPIQVSGLLLPVKKTFAPYVLAGIGWYKHRVEALDSGEAVASAYSTDFGYHTGLGAQIRFGGHAAVFVDYRYVWVDANGIDGITGALKSAKSVISVVSLLTSFAGDGSEETSISRGGSMWTGGLTIYF